MVISAQWELFELDWHVAGTKAEAVKKTTKKNMLSQLNAYTEFCSRFNQPPFPADNIQLCRFGQYLVTYKKFRSAESVGNYISGIRTCHALLGLQIPEHTEKQMQLFTQGLKRVLIHEVKQAAPLTPQLLVRISVVVDYTSQVDMVAWMATLLGFYMFMRSNLVPENMDNFNPEEQFMRKDFNIMSPETAMMVDVRWSKTVQYKQKILRYPVLPAKNKAICPVLWTRFIVNTVRAEPEDSIFTIWADGHKKTLSANQLVGRLRKWLGLIKEPAEEYSLHSMRRGGTFAYQSNIEAEMIQLLGNWASDAYKRYIDVSIDKKYNTMQAFVEALNRVA